jgi:gamma-glutamylputrescine oxidase
MTIYYWQDAHKQKSVDEVDVAIIGGGIMGAASAYWLSQRKGLKVAVVEAQKCGWGASMRNGGFVLRGLFAYYNQAVAAYGRAVARELLQFNEQTQQHLAEFAKLYGERFLYEPCGSYLLACSLEELQALEESAQLMADDGFEVQFIKHDPIKRDYYGALFNRCDAGVHSGLLVETLFDVAGVPVYEGEPVWRLERKEAGGIIVHTTGRQLHCSRVLLVTNAYAPLLEPWFTDKVHPVRGQVIVTKPLKKRILDNLCYANYGWEYFRQLPDNRFLLGGCRQMYRTDEVGYADMVTPAVQTALHNYLRDRFPEAAAVDVDYRWSGIMAFTRDELPIIGELVHQPVVGGEHVEPVPGVFYAVGCNGHGMGYSFALSKLLVEVALAGADAGVFATDRLLQSGGVDWQHALA